MTAGAPVAALPMYDFPEISEANDALWRRIASALRAKGVEAPAALERARYAYRLTQKGIQVALLFPPFHKRLCGPLANSRFHHQPGPQHRPNSRSVAETGR